MTLQRFNLLADALCLMEATIEQDWDDEAEAEKALAELDAVWSIVRNKWGHLAAPAEAVTQ
jgi:hypothetical protein